MLLDASTPRHALVALPSLDRPHWLSQDPVLAAAAIACLVFGVGCLLLILVLVAIRNGTNLSRARRAEIEAPLRRMLLGYAMIEADEEPDPTDRALEQQVRSLTGTQQRHAEPIAFSLLGRLAGESRARMAALIVEWGGAQRALDAAASGRPARRCHGLHRLGLLAHTPGLPRIIDALVSTSADVRRVALDACAHFPHQLPLEEMTDATVTHPDLRRDYLATLAVIGGPAGPALRDHLTANVRHLRQLDLGDHVEDEALFRVRLLIEAVGVVAEPSAKAALVTTCDLLLGRAGPTRVAATSGPDPEAAHRLAQRQIVLAALQSLGRLRSPAATGTLVAALAHPDAAVRRTAAAALGEIGDPDAAPALGALTDDDDLPAARAAAAALARCGARGQRLLAHLDTPAAAEARALRAATQTLTRGTTSAVAAAENQSLPRPHPADLVEVRR